MHIPTSPHEPIYFYSISIKFQEDPLGFVHGTKMVSSDVFIYKPFAQSCSSVNKPLNQDHLKSTCLFVHQTRTCYLKVRLPNSICLPNKQTKVILVNQTLSVWEGFGVYTESGSMFAQPTLSTRNRQDQSANQAVAIKGQRHHSRSAPISTSLP